MQASFPRLLDEQCFPVHGGETRVSARVGDSCATAQHIAPDDQCCVPGIRNDPPRTWPSLAVLGEQWRFVSFRALGAL